jgi:hypothetical protein
MDTQKNTALITGASAGIGRAFAHVFAENDFDLVVVARRAEKLEELKKEIESEYGVAVTVLAKDLSEQNASKEIADELFNRKIEIEVLVNNAGLATVAPLHEANHDDIMNLINVNVVALSSMTKLFVDQMVDRGHGRVINVASIVSFFPTPNFAAYGASKAYVLSLSEALSQELKGTGVTVTAVCPGYTKTDMISGAVEQGELHSMDKLVPAAFQMDAMKVAREGYQKSQQGRAVHINGIHNQMAAEWIRFQPRWFVRNAGGMMSRLLNR